jgi:sugar phosphate isomerase/epimerase
VFKAVVLHLGLKGDEWNEAVLERSLTAIEHLKAFAGPLGVRLLLENLENDIATPEHLLEIVRVGHFDSVGVCLDVGHLHLARPNSEPIADSGVGAAIDLLGRRIAQLHLHDNHGAIGSPSNKKDEHLWPGEGTIQWAALVERTAALPPATAGILEIACDFQQTADAVTNKAEAAFRKLEELAAAGAGNM